MGQDDDQDQADQLNQQGGNKPSGTPEADPFAASAEYSPIQEYVEEPQIEHSLQEHMQQSNPAFKPLPDIPLTPTQTPLVPGIQPVQIAPLPLSDLEVEKELKTNVYNAIRWLAEWCLRQLQMKEQKQNTPQH